MAQSSSEKDTKAKKLRNFLGGLLGKSEMTVLCDSRGTVISPHDGSKITIQNKRLEKDGELVEALQRVEVTPSSNSHDKEPRVYEKKYNRQHPSESSEDPIEYRNRMLRQNDDVPSAHDKSGESVEKPTVCNIC